MQGYVGPSTIVADFGSILVFFFDYIFLGITPNVYKLIGAFIAIVGIIVMVYKDIRKK